MSGRLLDAVPLSSLTGVGAAQSSKLAKIGLHTVQDLLLHLPLRYEDRTHLYPIAELLPGVFLFPSIDIINQEDTHFERFWVQQEDGCKIPDTFQDELAMVLVEPEGFSVLSACSHRGITNILRTVQAAFPESPCKLLLGGFHIHNAEKQKYQVIADYLQEYLPRQIGVCHCTGVDKYAFFYKDFGDSTFYNYTGKLIQTDLSE